MKFHLNRQVRILVRILRSICSSHVSETPADISPPLRLPSSLLAVSSLVDENRVLDGARARERTTAVEDGSEAVARTKGEQKGYDPEGVQKEARKYSRRWR